MDYQETLQYLFSRLPMYQRVGGAAYKEGLDNIISLCSYLGNPQNAFRSIHIAGTNGKGSTSHLLAAILQNAGLKTGLFTSPHLKSFTERIKVNGEEITAEAVAGFVQEHHNYIENMCPSFFEITVAMAFDYFATEKVDVAIIEVGLGGRLDSTNIINPLLSIITNISLDHTEFLGKEIKQIAFEKGGIIKTGKPVILSEDQTEVTSVIKSLALQRHAPFFLANGHFSFHYDQKQNRLDIPNWDGEEISNIKPQLTGEHQLKNLQAVLLATEVLKKEYRFDINAEQVKMAIEKVGDITGLKGRWQKLGEGPLIFCDVAHNEEGVKTVVKQINHQNFQQLHIVWGTVKDKDISTVLTLLPKLAHYYFCKPDIPRGLEVGPLWEMANKTGLEGKPYPTVKEAIQAAKKNAQPDDLIFIGGSTFVVAEIESL